MKDKRKIWVTTSNNPFDPFSQFNRWMNFDEEYGYHTCGELARIAPISDNLTDYENDFFIDMAVNELLDRETVVGNDGKTVDYTLAVEGECKPW